MFVTSQIVLIHYFARLVKSNKFCSQTKMAELNGLKLEQRHGKSRVRVARVWRYRYGKHQFAEWSVSISLLSDCLPAYISGDNSDIVATDTMKNTVIHL